ncbi:hypothetical protein ACFFRR_003260 [Megaselia abdita]
MKFLVLVPLLVAAVCGVPLGHVVDSRIGHSIHQGSHVVGHHQGHPQVSQTLIPGYTRSSSHQGQTRVREQVVGGSPAVSHYQNVIDTPITVTKQHNSVVHTSRQIPVVTRIAEQKLVPVTTYRDVHSTQTVHESHPVSHITKETHIQRQIQRESVVHGH